MDALRAALRDLFTEVFLGTPPGANGTWFVQGSEALNATLGDLSAEEASHSPGPGMSTIAAHTIHTAYYLELANASFRGQERDGDWAGSWKKQVVDEAEWTAAKAELEAQKRAFQEVLADADLGPSQEKLTYAIANVAHSAYHLGAIRQLFQLAKGTA